MNVSVFPWKVPRRSGTRQVQNETYYVAVIHVAVSLLSLDSFDFRADHLLINLFHELVFSPTCYQLDRFFVPLSATWVVFRPTSYELESS